MHLDTFIEIWAIFYVFYVGISAQRIEEGGENGPL